MTAREDTVKLALYETTTIREPQPGLLTERGVIGIADLVPAGHTPQATMINLIDGFERLRPALEKRARKGPVKLVTQENWRSAVFGYTGMIDVSARGEGRRTWKTGSWLGKSFDTFAPIGPCITAADEIPNPNDVHIQFWVDGQLRHNYNTDDMEHLVPELVEFATTIMTLNSGDVIACGT